MNGKAAIIIVNWNGLRFLKDCLTSVYKQSYQNFDVYFVDNGSKDESVVFVKNNFPKVRIIELKENAGFAGGNNAAMKVVFQDQTVEYICCLNNDTIVNNFWLEELIKIAEKDNKIGAVTSKAYFSDGKTINNAGLRFEKVLQANQKGGISLGYGLTDGEAPEYSTEMEVFAAGGVAPLYRRDVLERLYQRDHEVFDEDFFAYVEDLDLGFRIRGLGYKAVLAPRATLIHLHSQTGGKASPFKAYYCERNTILTAVKNLPLVDVLLFPFRNIVLKASYITNKHESVQKLQENSGFIEILFVLVKAHFFALLYIPGFLIKRFRFQSLSSFNSSNKRILVISSQSPTNANGGAVVLRRRLIELSYYFDIYLIARDYKPTQEGLEYFKKTWILEKVKFKNVFKLVYVYFIKTIKILYKSILNEHISIVQIEYYDNLIYAIFLLPFRLVGRVKVFYTAHDIECLYSTKGTARYWFIRTIETMYFKYFVDSIFVWGADDRSELINWGISSKKLVIIPPILRREDRLWKNPVGSKDFCFLGSWFHQPNQDTLNYILKKIWPSVLNFSPDSKLYLILGKTGKNFKPDARNVVNLGYVENIYDTFDRCVALLTPIISGTGIRIKIAESFGYGFPVLTTGMGFRNFSKLDHSKVLIAENDEGFIEKIRNILSGEVDLDEISSYEVSYAEDNFSLLNVEKYIQLYLSLE